MVLCRELEEKLKHPINDRNQLDRFDYPMYLVWNFRSINDETNIQIEEVQRK